MIRPVCDTDIPAVLAFWNPAIRDTTITFSSEEKTVAGLAAMIATRRAEGHETFVAVQGGAGAGGAMQGGAGAVLGLATYARFRAGNGYARAMEHTVILAPQARGRGIGRALMRALEDQARAAGVHVMVAGVSGENVAGMAFHAAMGYAETGRMPQVGYKFGRWLDLVLMQKFL